VKLAQRFGGRAYFETHPEAVIRLGYDHFAGRVWGRFLYFDLTPTSDRCELTIEIDASTGELLTNELGCPGGRP